MLNNFNINEQQYKKSIQMQVLNIMSKIYFLALLKLRKK